MDCKNPLSAEEQMRLIKLTNVTYGLPQEWHLIRYVTHFYYYYNFYRSMTDLLKKLKRKEKSYEVKI